MSGADADATGCRPPDRLLSLSILIVRADRSVVNMPDTSAQSSAPHGPSWPSILGATGAVPLPRSKGEAVYHAVRRAILLGALGPGEALIEQQIAGAMGCSQGTVREALLRLEQDGLVSRRGYQGTQVSTTTPEEAAQMVRIRLALETDGVRRAVPRLGGSERAMLETVVNRMASSELEGDAYALSELDRDFHLTVFRASQLTALEPILLRCTLHIHRHTFGIGKDPVVEDGGAMERGSVQHRRLMDVLFAGDADAAAEAMRQHIEGVVGFWSPEVSEAVLS